VGAIALLAFWCFLMQFVQNSSYNYLGALASFTPIVIIFGYRLTGISAELSVERYALVRMEEISIGVLVALLISSLLWPVSSIRLLRSEIMVSVESFKNAVGNTMEIYDRLVLDDNGRHPTTQHRNHLSAPTHSQQQAEEEEEKVRHRSAVELQAEMLTKAHGEAQSMARAACIPGDMSDGDKHPPSPLPVSAPETEEMGSQQRSTQHSDIHSHCIRS